MKQFTDILEGYCHPRIKENALNPMGETGLTERVHRLVFLDAAVQSMIRLHFWRFATRFFGPTHRLVLGMLRECWGVELLRITDKIGKKGRENLTIRLLHQRFNDDPRIPAPVREEEKQLFDALDAEYDAHNLYRVRCKEIFHLDLQTNLQEPRETGVDMHTMTMLVLSWYKFVGTFVNGVEPKYVTVGAGARGRDFVRDLRRMMIAQIRHWRIKSFEPVEFRESE